MAASRVRAAVATLATASLFLVAATTVCPAGDGPWTSRLKAHHGEDPQPGPPTVGDLATRIDCVADAIRNDGLVVIKQPDVYSQARLTRYRKEFETEMSKDLNNFQLILSARVNRLDSATTTSTTTLGAALGPKGSTSVAVPTPMAIPTQPEMKPIDFSKTAFNEVKVGQKEGSLGVEPTIYLEEKRRFLEHLNEIRRISLGPDQNDASGYGLYLLRFPVSITPGEKTLEGHGADLSLRVEHEFGPDFLPSSIRNLVVNDLVSQLGPEIYEILRSGVLDGKPSILELRANIPKLTAERDRLIALIAGNFAHKLAEELNQLTVKITDEQVAEKIKGLQALMPNLDDKALKNRALGELKMKLLQDDQAARLLRYILRDSTAIVATMSDGDPLVRESVAGRVEAVRNVAIRLDKNLALNDGRHEYFAGAIDKLETIVNELKKGEVLDDVLRQDVESDVETFIIPLAFDSARVAIRTNRAQLVPFFTDLYKWALPDDVKLLDDYLKTPESSQTLVTQPYAKTRVDLVLLEREITELPTKLSNLPSTRNPKQMYPVPNSDMPDIFLRENLVILAQEAMKGQFSKTPRETEVRNWLRQSLYNAFDVMSKGRSRPDIPATPILLDTEFVDRIHTAVVQRQFEPGANPGETLQGQFNELVGRLTATYGNVSNRPLAALCWAIAVDSGLLDESLREDVVRTFQAQGQACPDLAGTRFYMPTPEAREVFAEYVKLRWPIVTFALDPVTDQQNIADSFSMQRDLQLALSFAFATGQINFNQMNTFRRQIQLTADTIALNRTVTAYAHGNDIFGFRFTPRYQNPPNQKTNIGVIASQLISGGPGPNYGVKKSKLEAGQRELTAVMLMPTFMPTVRMEVASNWFKLVDPEHPIVPTRRMMELGREVVAVRQAFATACNSHAYRASDIRVLQAKIEMLEAMLPQQSRVVQLPFENTATGFELFSEGVTALVPEIAGFEGVDEVHEGKQAHIFIFGKYFSVLESHVNVGGVALVNDEKTPQFNIISREVIEILLPTATFPTVTVDGKTYLEVHVATPNGISNRVLVPYRAATATPQSALKPKDDESLRKSSARQDPTLPFPVPPIRIPAIPPALANDLANLPPLPTTSPTNTSSPAAPVVVNPSTVVVVSPPDSGSNKPHSRLFQLFDHKKKRPETSGAPR